MCEASKLCEEFEQNYRECSKSLQNKTCDIFLEQFQKLAHVKSCKYSSKKKGTYDGFISALSKCDEGRSYPEQIGIKTKMLVDDLIALDKKARNYYISEDFRSILSEESSEAFKDKSRALEKYYGGKVLSPKETYKKENIKKLDKILSEGHILEDGWILLNSYLTVKMPTIGEIDVYAIPNYEKIAKVIANERDAFFRVLYLHQMLFKISSKKGLFLCLKLESYIVKTDAFNSITPMNHYE